MTKIIYFKMQIRLSSLELVNGDVSTLIHQMELTYISYMTGVYLTRWLQLSIVKLTV